MIDNIANLFVNSYCISLNRRKDKWDMVKDEFLRVGIHPIRFSGVDGMKLHQSIVDSWMVSFPDKKEASIRGKIGCALSHSEVWKLAYKKGHPYTCVFEDDVLFTSFWKSRQSDLCNVPNNWDAIWLTGRPTRRKTHITGNVYKFTGMVSTVAYILHNRMLLPLIDLVSSHKQAIDETLNSYFMPNYNVYGIYPFSIGHRDGYSDISIRHATAPGLKKHIL